MTTAHIDIDDLIRQAVDEADDDFTIPVLAAKLAARFRESHRDALDRWLEEHTEFVIGERVRSLIRRDRAVRLRRRSSHVFADAAERMEAGDDAAFDALAIVYVVDDDRTRRRLREMTSADCLYVADHYRATAAEAQLEEAFLRAIAGKVGKRKVGEVFDAAKLQRLRDSIVKGHGKAA